MQLARVAFWRLGELLGSLLLPKTYTATTAVVVDVKSADPIIGLLLPAELMSGYMATQVDIITSDRVAQRVVKILKLDQAPAIQQQWRDDTDGGRGTLAQWMAPRLQKKLDVKPSRESNVINISYWGGFSSADPQFVSMVANAFAQAYIDISVELRVEPAKQYAAWFDARTRQLRDNLEPSCRKRSARFCS